jgi:hypothetical protein
MFMSGAHTTIAAKPSEINFHLMASQKLLSLLSGSHHKVERLKLFSFLIHLGHNTQGESEWHLNYY